MNDTQLTALDTVVEFQGQKKPGFVDCDPVEFIAVDETSKWGPDRAGQLYYSATSSDGEFRLVTKGELPSFGKYAAKCKVTQKGDRLLKLFPLGDSNSGSGGGSFSDADKGAMIRSVVLKTVGMVANNAAELQCMVNDPAFMNVLESYIQNGYSSPEEAF